MEILVVPLSQTQIDAANRLHTHLRQWRATDDALAALGIAFPQWALEATLLKVAAINQLYFTNVFAVNRMAEHITTLMATTADPTQTSAVLVEQIASLPRLPGEARQWHFWSFASKFAHFFINSDLYPIYDRYAGHIVEWHLGRKGRIRDEEHVYQAYLINLQRLQERSEIVCQGRELDHYLWLRGQYDTWQRNKTRKEPEPVNSELQRLFDKPPTQQDANDLVSLCAF